MSTMSEPTAQIVHEKQSWQRCALHAINNLLQLSPKDPSGFESRLYHGGKSLSLDVSPACTRKELDDIADNLTVRENDLTSTTLKISEVRRSPSFYVRCRSHHGAPVFGNYSYEVVETALERRNIRLERIEADKQEAIDINDCVTDEDSAGLIGFVVNVEVHATGLVMRVAQRLLWPGGRHQGPCVELRTPGSVERSTLAFCLDPNTTTIPHASTVMYPGAHLQASCEMQALPPRTAVPPRPICPDPSATKPNCLYGLVYLGVHLQASRETLAMPLTTTVRLTNFALSLQQYS